MAALLFHVIRSLPDATPIIYPPPNNSAITIGSAISTDTSYSFFKAAVTKAGMLAALSDSTKLFTVFLPNNDAFRVSRNTFSCCQLIQLPLSMLVPLVQYHIIPGPSISFNQCAFYFSRYSIAILFNDWNIAGYPY